MRVLVTRPLRDAEATARRLIARGHEAILAPVMEIVATGAPAPRDYFEGLIATSAHAIELASPDILKQHVASTLWCVGARTAAAARARGFSAIEEPAPDARDLAARMIAREKPRSHYLYLAGRDRKPFLEQALRDANHHVESLVVYEARAAATLPQVATAALGASEVDAILHFSRRSVDLLLSLVRDAGIGEALTRARHVCISDDAAAPLRAAGIEARVAATPDFPGLVAALEAVT